MLESPERGKEDSDERHAVQSREDHWHFEGSGVKTSTIGELCRKNGVSEQTFYRRRTEHGGLSVSEARRLKDLEKENSRLKRFLAERDVEIDVMKDMLSKKS
jgi:putative transposase